VAGDVSNPQSLNLYAYALNNPTTVTDPLGLQGSQNGLPCDPFTGLDCSGLPAISLIPIAGFLSLHFHLLRRPDQTVAVEVVVERPASPLNRGDRQVRHSSTADLFPLPVSGLSI
jgi:hypothetical protein